jgi:hypothetical protein
MVRITHATEPKGDVISNGSEVLEDLLEKIMVLCRALLAIVTNDDCSDMANEDWMLSDLQERFHPLA